MSTEIETCITCLEDLGSTPAQACGHRIHLSCLEKQFKPECPLCRATLDIEVSGELPSADDFVPDETGEIGFLLRARHDDESSIVVFNTLPIVDVVEEDWPEEWIDSLDWRLQGYNYIEESLEYDEENRYVDWNY